MAQVRLTSADLEVGATYIGIRPDAGERTIEQLENGYVKYSAPNLPRGVPWPVVPVWQFLAWTKERKWLKANT